MEKLKIEYVDIDSIKPYKNNAKLHPAEQIEQIKKSIELFGMDDPIGIWKDEIVEGHGRLIACKELGMKEVPIIRLDHLTDEERKAYTLAHNKLTMNSDFDIDLLNEELEDITSIDMEDFGFDLDLDEIEIDKYKDKMEKGSLTRDFIVPPFSVLDTKAGYWQNRKKEWIDLGIKSELGRDENLIGGGQHSVMHLIGNGTSIFDPVLCEICYKWFNIDNGKIYDPFAGGSVRGIVAEKLGYNYQGIDLRQEQIDANNENAKELGVKPIWYCDDSNNVDKYIEDNSVDMIFSCPPYADLEVYSDKPNDLSNMEYEDFKKAYKDIISKACKKLKENRFAVFVVGDVRDKKGIKRNFVDYTVQCFIESGLVSYNEAILLNAVGTSALRARTIFKARKLVNMHQYVLVFYKGDVKQIKDNYNEINLDDVLEEENEEW